MVAWRGRLPTQDASASLGAELLETRKPWGETTGEAMQKVEKTETRNRKETEGEREREKTAANRQGVRPKRSRHGAYARKSNRTLKTAGRDEGQQYSPPEARCKWAPRIRYSTPAGCEGRIAGRWTGLVHLPNEKVGADQGKRLRRDALQGVLVGFPLGRQGMEEGAHAGHQRSPTGNSRTPNQLGRAERQRHLGNPCDRWRSRLVIFRACAPTRHFHGRRANCPTAICRALDCASEEGRIR